MGTVLLAVAAGAAGGAAIAAAFGAVAGSRADSRQRATRIALVTLVALMAAAAALLGATVRLTWAILRLDFSFEYVAEQSRRGSSSAYRLAALWGGAEGSLLMFTTLLTLVLLGVVVRYGLRGWGVAVPAAIVAITATTNLLAAGPFDRAELPAVRGAGLTPILEHPAMLYHPPILYLGLATTLVPFAVALGGDVRQPEWSTIRRWTLVAWTLLTIGLATGANWAYVEVGWGGYWAWDPVENTVLMPWLVLTAALHVAASRVVRDRSPRLALGLAMTPFVLVLFGSTVTRSGRLSSVHAFAEATEIGYGLGSAVVIGLLAMIARLRSATPRVGRQLDLTARSSRPLLEPFAAVGLALFATTFVFMGVGLPLLPGSDRVVPAAFYNRVGAPVLLLALLALAVPIRRHSPAPGSWPKAPLVAGAIAAGAGAVAGIGGWLALGVVTLGSMVVFAGVRRFVRAGPNRFVVHASALLGHVGFVVLALGIVGSAQATEIRTVLAPGESQPLGPELTVTYTSFTVTDGPRPGTEASTVTAVVSDGNDEIATLRPGLISYPDRAVVLAETSLHSTLRRDIQVVVRVISDDGLATFDLAERPYLQLVWWGSALIAASGAAAVAATFRQRTPATRPNRDVAFQRR